MGHWRRLAVSFALAGALLVSAGAMGVAAGTNGQQLSPYDYYGHIASGYVYGTNQNCQFAYDAFSWPNHWYDTSGWYWQDWSGCGSYAVEVYGRNSSGTQVGSWYIGPPHNQGSDNWYSCQVDGPAVNCLAGYQNTGVIS